MDEFNESNARMRKMNRKEIQVWILELRPEAIAQGRAVLSMLSVLVLSVQCISLADWRHFTRLEPTWVHVSLVWHNWIVLIGHSWPAMSHCHRQSPPLQITNSDLTLGSSLKQLIVSIDIIILRQFALLLMFGFLWTETMGAILCFLCFLWGLYHWWHLLVLSSSYVTSVHCFGRSFSYVELFRNIYHHSRVDSLSETTVSDLRLTQEIR